MRETGESCLGHIRFEMLVGVSEKTHPDCTLAPLPWVGGPSRARSTKSRADRKHFLKRHTFIYFWLC